MSLHTSTFFLPLPVAYKFYLIKLFAIYQHTYQYCIMNLRAIKILQMTCNIKKKQSSLSMKKSKDQSDTSCLLEQLVGNHLCVWPQKTQKGYTEKGRNLHQLLHNMPRTSYRNLKIKQTAKSHST